MSLKSRISKTQAPTAAKTVMHESQALLHENKQVIDKLTMNGGGITGSQRDRTKLLQLVTNLAKMKAFYEDLLPEEEDEDIESTTTTTTIFVVDDREED